MKARAATTFHSGNEIKTDQVSIHATALSLAEIGLGSTLHALHVPFAGTILSLNQIFLLTRSLSLASFEHTLFSPFSISACAALFKCLAPVGKKLTPMLAICMQGLLYSLGILCFGNTLLGRLIGGVLSSLWSFCQPFLLYSLLFGPSYFQTIHAFTGLQELFLGLLIVKIIVASLIVLLTPKVPLSGFEQYLHKLSCLAHSKKQPMQRSPVRQAISDLFKPLFLFSLLMTALFFYFSQGFSEALLWGILRPLGVGFLCFFLMRLLPVNLWLQKKQGRFEQIFKNLKALIGE